MKVKKTSNGATAYRMREAIKDAGISSDQTEQNGGKCTESGEHTKKRKRYACALFSLDYKPVFESEDVSLRPDLFRMGRELLFYYGQPYRLISNSRAHMAFMLYSNDASTYAYMANKENRRFHTYEDFCKRADENKFLALLRDCSNLTKEMFDVAKANPLCQFTISMDVEKYLRKVGQPTCFNVLEDRI